MSSYPIFQNSVKNLSKLDKKNLNKMPGQRKGQRMTEAEKKELPSSLFILSGTNCFRRAAVWFVRWFVFEWVIILTIIGKKMKMTKFVEMLERLSII